MLTVYSVAYNVLVWPYSANCSVAYNVLAIVWPYSVNVFGRVHCMYYHNYGMLSVQ